MRFSIAGLVSAAALAACGAGPTEPGQPSAAIDAVAKVAQAAAAVTGQEAKFANDAEKGHYVGFDTHTYPGTAVMKTWKKTPGSPYSWVGYYLPSPCHDDRSWVGRRDTLVAMGWGLAAVYVGEQTWGKTPRSLTPAQADKLRAKNDCSADLLSADEGTRNADDATAKAASERFPKGAVVFLDIEHMDKIPAAMRDYYKAWTARMLANGQYTPGFYAHEANAQEIFGDVRAVFQAAGDTTTPRMWLAGGKGFDTGKAPQDVGYAFAGVWQGVIDVARSVAKVRLPVDVNVASWKSPSESGL
ncbi:MAG TPA: glycoside hydrolase domain-containing protein [Gemmatimonadaceae bacterium]|nr:glycoside hydrolase domain-containing protein [Gemmatimonadaceae bacterium]